MAANKRLQELTTAANLAGSDLTVIGQGTNTFKTTLSLLTTFLGSILTGADIKVAYEGEADTNEFSDAEQTKLSGIETSATADQSNAEIETAYNAQVGAMSQAVAEAGTSTTILRVTAERIKQAIAALGTVVTLPPSHINGLVMSAGTDTVNDINITVGEARSGADDADLVVTTAFGKRIDADWVTGGTTGTPTGGISSSLTLANDTWYHVILGNVSGSEEVGFDTSVVGANLVSDHSFTNTRRIGSVLRGTDLIELFTARETAGGGLEVQWDDPPLDVDDSALSPSTAETYAMSVPIGYQVLATLNVSVFRTSTSAIAYIFSLSSDDEDPDPSAAPAYTAGGTSGAATNKTSGGIIHITTDTSAQIKARSGDATTTFIVATIGWNDARI